MGKNMKWDSTCRLGIHEIDSQHRLLFAIAGELEDIEKPDEQGPEIRYVIDHIRKYVKEHFHFEEQVMEKTGCPGLPKHRTAHKQIVDEVKHTLTSSKNLTALKEQLEYMMTVWIRDHILDDDRKFADWSKEAVQK